MAYVRSNIVPKAAEVVRKLSEDGRKPTVGDMVQAVVDAGICGRGVAQQIVAELRKTGAMGQAEAGEATMLSDPLAGDIDSLLQPFDDLHRRIDEVRIAVGQALAISISQMKATLGAVIADQGVAGKRADEDNQAEIARLETELAQVLKGLAEASAKVEEGEHHRADLYARVIEADEAVVAYRAQVEVLEAERSRYQDEANNLRVNLDGYRRDLDATRQAEADLRAEVRRLTMETVTSSEYEALQNRLAGTDAALTEERIRNAELHAQVLKLVGAMTGPAETTTALPA